MYVRKLAELDRREKMEQLTPECKKRLSADDEFASTRGFVSSFCAASRTFL